MNSDTASGIDRLRQGLGDVTIRTERHYRITYRYDATGRSGECGGVAFPADEDELRRVVERAGELGIPIVPRGAGTGFSGGSVPVGGALVVSTERLRRILRFEPEAAEVEVECGVVNEELQDFLAKRGFFYPPDPASLKFSTIGGNIAENAGGPRAYKYGVTRRYVRRLRWITADGRPIESPPRGPASLLVGSEGTLGIISSARLAVLPRPEIFRAALVAAGEGAAALETASALLATGFTPSVLEYIDSKTMRCVLEYIGGGGELAASGFADEGVAAGGDRGGRGHADDGPGYLFLEMDGSRHEVAGQSAVLESFCGSRGLAMHASRDERGREALWELRRSVSPSLARRGVTKVNEDVSLPLGRLGEAVSFAHGLAAELRLDCYIFGHAGDGNLHVNIMTDRRRKDEMERVGAFVERLFARVAEWGGTLSGEHGIGLTKGPYLGMVFSPDEIAFQRRIKSAMDGRGVLNPGKYFDMWDAPPPGGARTEERRPGCS